MVETFQIYQFVKISEMFQRIINVFVENSFITLGHQTPSVLENLREQISTRPKVTNPSFLTHFATMEEREGGGGTPNSCFFFDNVTISSLAVISSLA